jgi:predicted DNA-binding transcriptional regulator YafY
MRGDQLVRQWELLRLLLAYPEGLRVEDIAEALRANRRAVYRDIEVLKAARFNIQTVRRGKESFYFIPSDNPVLPVDD